MIVAHQRSKVDYFIIFSKTKLKSINENSGSEMYYAYAE